MDQLQQLVGLKLPDSISWWPLAPGWYVVSCLLCIVLLFVTYKKRKKYAKNAYRRDALSRLQFMSVANATQLLSVISKALNYVLSEQVALTETLFISTLNQGLKQDLFDQQDWFLLTQWSFQPINEQSFNEPKFMALKVKCEQWVKEHDYEHRA